MRMYIIGDKEGEDSLPKHVYANPSNPEICPILWFAVWIWSQDFRRGGAKTTIFCEENSKVEDRFSNWLRTILDANEQQLLIMGITIMNIGTHSFRKGVATFLSGMPGGPTAISIYLRAGWSLGRVQQRYILQGEGGDQLAGRAASGLSLTDVDFAILPPHFDVSSGPVLSVSQWEDILPGFTTFYPASFRQVLPYLLAALVFHRKYLVEHLPCNHPLFLSRLWTSGIMNSLEDKVHIGIMRNSITKMTATGIPPHIILANEIIGVKEEMKTLREEVILKIETIPEAVKLEILKNFEVNGVVPITEEKVETMLSGLKNLLLAAIAEQGEMSRKLLTSSQTGSATDSATNGTGYKIRTLEELTFDGRIHRVPRDFRFPRCSIRFLWDLWWDGNKAEGFPPYRKLEGVDLTSKQDHVLLSKAKGVMKFLLSCVGQSEEPITSTSVASLSKAERDRLFERVYCRMCCRLYSHESVEEISDSRNIGSLHYSTLFDKITKT
jgi:hypothetical protein